MATLIQYQRALPYQGVPTYRDHNSHIAIKLDLNSLCIKRPKETFFIQVKNPHLLAWGIDVDDFLIVEKGCEVVLNDLVVIEKKGEYRFYQFFNEVENQAGIKQKILFSLDSREENLYLNEWNEVQIAGVVTNVVHQVRNRILSADKKYAA